MAGTPAGSRMARALALANAPSPYDAAFAASGAKWGIDPKLLKAIGCWESELNPNAPVGAAGDTGIMQITPAGLGRQPSFDPVTNIDEGAEILSGFLRNSSGNVGLALARYNGGYKRPQAAYAQAVSTIWGGTQIA